MLILTLTQPWASLVVWREKLFETRGWRRSYRGPLAIHASAGMSPSARALCEQEPFRSAIAGRELPRGAVLGLVVLKDIVATDDLWLAEQLSPKERAFGDYGPKRYAWSLSDAAALVEPVPASGRLGLWQAKPEVINALMKRPEFAVPWRAAMMQKEIRP